MGGVRIGGSQKKAVGEGREWLRERAGVGEAERQISVHLISIKAHYFRVKQRSGGGGAQKKAQTQRDRMGSGCEQGRVAGIEREANQQKDRRTET